ncbi:Ig-like domain-containing protein [Roseibium polysiphoniae]|uniref:Autotransporter domain-containing protein n=1 Tax=Roseibium polysiphoniae TaxID=2571221 RepID=A0ABR9C7D2_9HYPH|nr:Ig-like domain-containing protein [Roseibium polysiphoniae]MBD8875802.1 hypothetical protein [Roseibium polysiphoniae]
MLTGDTLTFEAGGNEANVAKGNATIGLELADTPSGAGMTEPGDGSPVLSGPNSMNGVIAKTSVGTINLSGSTQGGISGPIAPRKRFAAILRRAGRISACVAGLLMFMPGDAQAFDAPSRIDQIVSLDSQCSFYVFVTNNSGGTAGVRIRRFGVETRAAGGVGFLASEHYTSIPAITAAFLQANCKLADVASLVQQGATGTYTAQGYMGVSFEATRTTDGDRYAYLAEIRGATGTTITVNQTLVNAAPTVTLGTPNGPDGSGNYTVTATLSESSSDFTASSLTLTNATATVSGSGSSYTIVLDPVSDGAVSASVPKGAFTDSEGLENWVASNEVTFLADTTPPTISIDPLSGPVAGEYTAAITLSEASTDFTLADLTLTNATATLSGSGTSYTATLTPVADGTVALSVAAGTFSDAVGNTNTAASNEVTATYDATAPTVSIAPLSGPVAGEYTATITLSEASTDFTLADLTLTNATATLSGSGTSYTAVLTPETDGQIALSVAAGSFTDGSGNTNAASNEVTATYDSTAPTVSIKATETSVTGPESINVTVTFSEDVTGFEMSDFSVANGAVTQLQGSGADYIATVASTGRGDLEISIPAGAATDASGNENTASNTLSIANIIVEQTQKVIAQFMQTRASQLLSSQPDLTGFLSGGSQGSFDFVMTSLNGNFDFASQPGINSGFWTRLNGSWTREGTAKSQYVFGAIGHHFKISPTLLVGGMLEFDYLSQQDEQAKINGHGWLAGPYAVARLPDHPLFVEGRLLYGQTSNDISPLGTYTDGFDTERILAQLKISGELGFEQTVVTPSVKLSYTSDDQEAYVDGLGNVIPEQGLELLEGELGLDVRHQVDLPTDSASLELIAGLSMIGSSTRGSGNAARVVPEYEGGRAKVTMGANYILPNGGDFLLDAYYDGIGVQDYESYGLQLGFKLAF